MERAKIHFALYMQNSYLDHPTEDELERFLLHQSQDEELEIVETHILACESCVARLETLETQIGATKLALERLQDEGATKKPSHSGRSSWKTWLATPRLAWVGAAAVLVFGIAFVPQFGRRGAEPAEVSLSAYRGLEAPVVPVNRPLHVRLNASDLAEGPVRVEVVDDQGARVWSGPAAIRSDRVDVTLPRIREPGAHFLRLYARAQGKPEGGLLREFAFKVE